MDIDAFVRLIDDSGLPAPGSQVVTAFEAATGLTLPDDYRAFLAKTPGGRLSKTVTFSLSGEEDGAEYLGRVAGLRTENSYSLEERVRSAAENAIPEGLLSIMTDRGGNALALAVRPDRFGQIFFLDHEVSDEGRPTIEEAESADWGYAIRFAATFSEMIAGFKAQD
ncbi:MAG: SMI1/KNR4 family protein [Pseudomonadota bacterium]